MNKTVIAKQIDEIMELGRRVFKTDVEIIDFLFTKYSDFDNATPIHLIQQGEGDLVIELFKSLVGR